MLLLAVLLSTLVPGGRVMGYEQPDYVVLSEAGNIEYRRYAPHLVAETLIEGAADFDGAGNEGFRRLFRYIAGGNTGQARIAMTAPVSQVASAPGVGRASGVGGSEKIAMTVPVQQARSPEGFRVAFMLPRQYTLATAPVPADPRVRVIEVPGRLMAVWRYSGRWTESNFVDNRDLLLQGLAAAGSKPLSAPELARYNAPFSLPFLRRNEILVEVDRAPP